MFAVRRKGKEVVPITCNQNPSGSDRVVKHLMIRCIHRQDVLEPVSVVPVSIEHRRNLPGHVVIQKELHSSRDRT